MSPCRRYYTSGLSLKMTSNDKKLVYLVKLKLLLVHALMHLPPPQKETIGLAWLIMMLCINDA